MADLNSPKIEFDKKGSTSRFNFNLNQYADNFFDFKIVGSSGTAYNLTGFGFSGTIRKHTGSAITASDNITVGFETSGQSLGIITARVNCGITTLLDKISPRYTYDIIATRHDSGYKRQLIAGDVNVNVGITQVTPAEGDSDSNDILGSNRICIAVIDESNDGDNAPSIAEYNAFRASFPNRKHYILQPRSSGVADTSKLMSSSISDIYVSGFGTDTSLNGNEIQVYPVNRDNNSGTPSDWFDIVGIETGTITKLALFVDISGSMTLNTVLASYNKFIGTCTAAGITVREESNQNEDWIEPFTGILA